MKTIEIVGHDKKGQKIAIRGITMHKKPLAKAIWQSIWAWGDFIAAGLLGIMIGYLGTIILARFL
ncbi:MAG: hypothetical protein WC871_02205 [Bacteroidales bacterium]|jgi:hypothetical protein